MTVAVPVAVLPWKVTEQLPAANVQLAALKTPPVVPADNVKATEPVGVIVVLTSVSVTVAVHDEVWSTTTLFGLQITVVEVDRLFTVIVFDVLGPLPL